VLPDLLIQWVFLGDLRCALIVAANDSGGAAACGH